MTRPLICLLLAFISVTYTGAVPAGQRNQQVLPHVPGYIPVYIHSGDSPPDVERLYESQRTLPLRAAPSEPEEHRVAPAPVSQTVPRRPAAATVVSDSPIKSSAQDIEPRTGPTRNRIAAPVAPTLLEQPRVVPVRGRTTSPRDVGLRDSVEIASHTNGSKVTKKGGVGPAPLEILDNEKTSPKKHGGNSYRESYQHKPAQQHRPNQHQRQKAAQTRKRQQKNRANANKQPPSQK